MLLRWRRRHVADIEVLGRYLVLANAARFALEFIRINERVALAMTVAEWITLVAAGALLLTRNRAPVSSSR